MKRNRGVAAGAVVLSIAGLMLWRSQDGAFGGVSPALPEQASSSSQSGGRPRVDIVFALDTTSSMTGLIDGAKAKIWEIARRAQEGQPAPEVRIGLVAYRDRGDEYVTKVLDLTGDLDLVYAKLTELQAAGGGDGPEHVIRGLNDAVNEVHWSQDKRAVKLVYLVGDAPPHEDYDDGLTLNGVLEDARGRGIRISAIRCGSDGTTLEKWTAIAQRTDGEVSSIAQNGGVLAAVATPYDAELARLNAELAKTEIHYGSSAERSAADAVVAANLAAPVTLQADRAGFYSAQAASKAGATKKDLAAAKPAAVAAVATADLPEEMQAMSAEDRAKFVETKRAEREAVLSQIKEANGKRAAHLKSAPKPRAAAGGGSFDEKVLDSLKKAGAEKGLAY
jgi:Mg-chelatase subunit ChlD